MAMKAKVHERPKTRPVPEESSVGTVDAPAVADEAVEKADVSEDLATAV
jgi:hypothetical protein